MILPQPLDFSADYFAARSKFRDRCAAAGWTLESFPISASGPGNRPLTIDAAMSPGAKNLPLLLLTSGLHGVEGFYGSAAQLAMLDEWRRCPSLAERVRVVLVHALNPYGFAWRRRFDRNHVDLNRAFRLPNELLSGCSAVYRRLDPFLNPRRPPSAWEPYRMKAAWLLARHGLPALQQAIAEGQYEFSQGLFFGGNGPSETQQILAANWGRWLDDSTRIMHFDFHTGLGPSGRLQLFPESPLSDEQIVRLGRIAGRPLLSTSGCEVAYHVRGGLGLWSAHQAAGRDAIVVCAELGTYGPVEVLSGLRAENQAHHWAGLDDPRSVLAKTRLAELFCPSRSSWRLRAAEETRHVLSRLIAAFKPRSKWSSD